MRRPDEYRISIDIPGQGLFISEVPIIEEFLKTTNKRKMVRDIAEMWPDLIRDGSWTKKYLMAQPAYVLAVILKQTV